MALVQILRIRQAEIMCKEVHIHCKLYVTNHITFVIKGILNEFVRQMLLFTRSVICLYFRTNIIYFRIVCSFYLHSEYMYVEVHMELDTDYLH